MQAACLPNQAEALQKNGTPHLTDWGRLRQSYIPSVRLGGRVQGHSFEGVALAYFTLGVDDILRRCVQPLLRSLKGHSVSVVGFGRIVSATLLEESNCRNQVFHCVSEPHAG